MRLLQTFAWSGEPDKIATKTAITTRYPFIVNIFFTVLIRKPKESRGNSTGNSKFQQVYILEKLLDSVKVE
jgi:hypothetical protein